MHHLSARIFTGLLAAILFALPASAFETRANELYG